MSKRLHVVLSDVEFHDLQRLARARGETVSEVVRRALRESRQAETAVDVDVRLAVLREAQRHAFPSGDIDDMPAQIESGYLS
jgi:Arc/MetJ-type ribon-helix-helix transcriptional regulator